VKREEPVLQGMSAPNQTPNVPAPSTTAEKVETVAKVGIVAAVGAWVSGLFATEETPVESKPAPSQQRPQNRNAKPRNKGGRRNERSDD